MKMPLLMFLFASAVCLGEAAGLLPESLRGMGNLEERRAEAMGKRLNQFVTMAGRVYRDVQITNVSDGGVSLSHADGSARLRFGDLSPEQRRYFGIQDEVSAAVYAREMRERAAYEAKVEESEKARRELAEKEAAERAEAYRIAVEKAAEARAIAAVARPAETIPSHPTIKRVDSGNRRSSRSSYSRYYGGYGYGYPVRYSYRPVFPYRTAGCGSYSGSSIHFSFR